MTDKATMIQVKSIVTFFQCAQLTTLIDIKWPKIALYLPFTIPYGDANCLTNQIGWDQQSTFFLYIYGSLLVVLLLLCNARRHGDGTILQNEAYQQLAFLVILFYSPLVQIAASMIRCQDDTDLGSVLSADPRVSCEKSLMRLAVHVHVAAVSSFCGLGLPAFVLWKMRDLRDKKQLTADSHFAGLFEWYSPRRPYWEAVLLAKKLCLVLAANTFIVDATTQALVGLAINTMYLFIFELKRPMLWYPSKTFKKQNLFHVLERGSSFACVVGSGMAVLGARKASIVDLVGGVFAVVNLLYVGIALYVFARDTKLKSLVGNQVLPVMSGGDTADDDCVCAKEMRGWDDQVRLIDEAGDMSPAAKEDMLAELMFLQSRVAAALERTAFERVVLEHGSEPGSEEGEKMAEWMVATEAELKRINDVGARVNSDSSRLQASEMQGDAREVVRRAQNLRVSNLSNKEAISRAAAGVEYAARSESVRQFVALALVMAGILLFGVLLIVLQN